jgi:hypothetical protein
MRLPATTIADYLEGLPDDRRAAISAVRGVILDSLPAGYVESLSCGMLAYEVPLSVYPDTYNKRPLMYAALASQKAHMAVYLCGVSGRAALRQELEAAFVAAGKRLDMGQACVRFRRLDELALAAIGRAIAATPMDAYVAFARSVHSAEARAERRVARAAPTSRRAGRA